MDKNFISIIVIAILTFLIISNNNPKKTCRSHDSFMFNCHHNDSNTDIYLRRLNTKLDKLLEQIDTTPPELKEKQEIDEETTIPKLEISCMLKQLKLLKSGKIRTGLLAHIIPNFLRNHEEQSFDHQTDVIVAFISEFKNYTHEEANIFKKTLLERTLGSDFINEWALYKIESNLNLLIRQELSEIIIKENGYKIPQNLRILVSNRYDITESKSKKEEIMAAVSNGEIDDNDSLDFLIRKVYFEKN